jgi:hypothetical protein
MAGAFFSAIFLVYPLEEVRVNIEEPAPDVVLALANEGVATGVLSSLTSLFLKG